jgi:chemotaxis protein methyltransferase CheR
VFTRPISASDIDHSALAWSQTGGPYSADEVANVPPAWLHRYFKNQDDRYYVVESLRRRVTFQQHNLLTERFEQGFDLIICYFTIEAKDHLYNRFYESLRPGGVLFVGGTEIVSKAPELGFETAGISFYRRKGIGVVVSCNPLLRSERLEGR